jgi:hypothetical protein
VRPLALQVAGLKGSLHGTPNFCLQNKIVHVTGREKGRKDYWLNGSTVNRNKSDWPQPGVDNFH